MSDMDVELWLVMPGNKVLVKLMRWPASKLPEEEDHMSVAVDLGGGFYVEVKRTEWIISSSRPAMLVELAPGIEMDELLLDGVTVEEIVECLACEGWQETEGFPLVPQLLPSDPTGS